MSRSDYQASEDDNVTVEGVAGDKGALGYFGFSYLEQNLDRLKAVDIDDGNGCVAPSVPTAQDGSYAPLSRPSLHVREGRRAPALRGGGVPRLRARERRIDRRGRAVRPAHSHADRGREDAARPGDAGNVVAAAEPSVVLESLRPSRRRYSEDIVRVVLFVAACISVFTTIAIILSLLKPAIDFFREISVVDFFTGTTWAPLFEPQHFGVVPLIMGTLAITFWASLIAIPCGLGTAIYLSEYARPHVRSVLKPALEVLAGIPTVVYGYFALTFFTPFLRDIHVDVEIFNVLSAGLVMGVMLIPTVASLSEDAMYAVPQDLRDGGYALGATRRHVATRVVVPAATSGIVASFVLAISRGIGETMIVLIAAGQLAQVSFDPRTSMETMTAFIGATAQGDVPTGSIEYKTIFAVGLALFVMTLVMNIISIRLVRRFREVYE